MTLELPHIPPRWRPRLQATIDANPTDENRRLLIAWARAEGGTAAYNPLNTTLKLYGSTPYNQAVPPVQNYPSDTAGVCATALTLTNGHYPNIVQELRLGIGAGSGALATAEDVVRLYRAEFEVWGTNPDTILALLAAI